MISDQVASAVGQASPSPSWTSYVTAAFTIFIASIGVWIAFRQSQIARNKLKLDLFERRMAVYEVVSIAIGRAVNAGKLTNQEQYDYLSGTRSSQWLFGPEVFEYIHTTLWHKIIDLELHDKMISAPPSDERTKHIHARSEVTKWLHRQYKEFDRLCEPYLKLNH
jgi:hypothetical protein